MTPSGVEEEEGLVCGHSWPIMADAQPSLSSTAVVTQSIYFILFFNNKLAHTPTKI